MHTSAVQCQAKFLTSRQCFQPSVFPANFDLFFYGVACFFEDLRVACFWDCSNRNLLLIWAMFFRFLLCGLPFFSNFVALVLFQFAAKGNLCVFL